MKLLHHHYGKARIRVMKVTRGGDQHSLKELDVSVMLQGNFDPSYTKADNSLVVPTDTMKNTVNVLHRIGRDHQAVVGFGVGRVKVALQHDRDIEFLERM